MVRQDSEQSRYLATVWTVALLLVALTERPGGATQSEFRAAGAP